MLQSKSPSLSFVHIHTATLPWLYKQWWGRKSQGGRAPCTGGHSHFWGWCRAACRFHPRDTLLCDRVSGTCAFHMVRRRCRATRRRYPPDDRECCFVTRVCPCTISELEKYKGDTSPHCDKNDRLDGHIHGLGRRSGYIQGAWCHRELAGRSLTHHSGRLIHQNWLANRSGSSHGDKALRIYEGHSGVSSRKSKDTCAPYPHSRSRYIYAVHTTASCYSACHT